MAILKSKFEHYTEAEFTKFLSDICLAKSSSETQFHRWLEHFEKVTEHPKSTDLFYYPLTDADPSPVGIVRTIKQWRAENGKPGFKVEDHGRGRAWLS